MDLIVEAKLLDGREARIFIEGGRVAALRGPAAPAGGARVYRAPPSTVAGPAFVDIHVHLRGLELSYKEDEDSGTRAALAGGVAVVVDMPNTRPELREPQALAGKAAALESRALVDYAVWAGVPWRPGDAAALASHTVTAGFKVYPEDLEPVRRPALEAAARAAEAAGKPLVLHPEVPWGVSEDCPLGRRGVDCRPPGAEVEAVAALAGALGGAGVRVHVTHATTPETLAAAAARGYTTDVTMHHVTFTMEHEGRGCEFKVNPPLRPAPIARGLRWSLAHGAVDAVASDHAPHSPGEKAQGHPGCPPGIPGVEYTSRLLLTMASAGEIPLPAVWTLYSSRPARIAGLRGYGCLSPGCRAAIVIVDPARRGVIGRTTRDYSRAGPQAWEGTPYTGEPVALILGGETVMEEGEVYEDAARRAARPAPAPG